jgi:predicted transposase YbfD/YdcC
VETARKLGEQLSASFGAIKTIFSAFERTPTSKFAFGYYANIAIGPRDNIQLAIYKEVRETKEFQRRNLLLQETQFLITNPGASNEQIEALYSGQYTSMSLANMLRRPALPSGNSPPTYTKSEVVALVDALHLIRKEKKLVEYLGAVMGQFIKKEKIDNKVHSVALSRMISTLNNEKLVRKGWKIERNGNWIDDIRYKLVKLKVEQSVTN